MFYDQQNAVLSLSGPPCIMCTICRCCRLSGLYEEYLLSRHTQYGRDTKFTVYFFHFVCTVTDFSAGALPIGVKFCMAVWPDLRQVFSYFGGIVPGMAEFWASTARHMAGYASCWSTCFINFYFSVKVFTVKHLKAYEDLKVLSGTQGALNFSATVNYTLCALDSRLSNENEPCLCRCVTPNPKTHTATTVQLPTYWLRRHGDVGFRQRPSYKQLAAVVYIRHCERCLMTPKPPVRQLRLPKEVIDNELRPFCVKVSSRLHLFPGTKTEREFLWNKQIGKREHHQ